MTAIPGLCIVHPNPGPLCETFIQAHIERLAPALVLHGGHMPLRDQAGNELMPDLPGNWKQLFSPGGLPENTMHRRASQTLADYLCARGVSVVLAEYGPTGVALAEPCRLAKIPLVVHFHGYDASLDHVLDKYRNGYARMLRQAAGVVVVSRRMKQDLLSLGVPRERLYHNACGVDTEAFKVTRPDENPPLFAAVGRFVDKKAPHLTILSFSDVFRTIPGARLVMIGDGPLREACVSLVHALHLTTAVALPGKRAFPEVAALLRRARAFVQHSITPENGDREGTPIAILEAGASGLPVVSTRHAGIPDAVVHGKSGFLCEEMDVKSMSSCMIRLAREPETAARMGLEARARVEAHYRMDRQIASLSRILMDASRRHP